MDPWTAAWRTLVAIGMVTYLSECLNRVIPSSKKAEKSEEKPEEIEEKPQEIEEKPEEIEESQLKGPRE